MKYAKMYMYHSPHPRRLHEVKEPMPNTAWSPACSAFSAPSGVPRVLPPSPSVGGSVAYGGPGHGAGAAPTGSGYLSPLYRRDVGASAPNSYAPPLAPGFQSQSIGNAPMDHRSFGPGTGYSSGSCASRMGPTSLSSPTQRYNAGLSDSAVRSQLHHAEAGRTPMGALGYASGQECRASTAGGGFGGLSAPAGLGTWGELIAVGVVDRAYIEKEAERRKKEIDRATDKQLADMENECMEQRSTIQQQAEYHTQMAEKQIEGHKRQHQAHIMRQAEIQAYAILQRADMEKGSLGHEAARALSIQSEREKAAIQYEAMQKAEDMWRQSQRALLEQAQKAKLDIELQAKKRTEDVEQQVREAVSRVYISANTANPVGLPAQGPRSFVPEPTWPEAHMLMGLR
ncbi:unnamed protein product [Polarella glacialis]|uniref:Uncharacterized protein n=1 Tax=Polarella glacialis TaxID=89957 RepID=A0A813F4H4_POLGL|nr:unnamed protein product [Polarella glacialis]